MRIYRPHEIHLMRLGLPATPCNGGGSGGETSSSQTTSTSTTNTDSRIANDGGMVATGLARNYSTVNNTSVDPEIAKAAFDFATHADTVNGDGFNKLLDVADRLTTKTSDTATSLASRFQDNVMQAYSQAKADAAGGIDQKTMIVLAVAATVGLVAIKRKGA